MKKQGVIFIAILFMSVTLLSFKYTRKFVNDATPQHKGLNIPENVKVIIDNKCYDCHNNKSKSKKAKTKLNFDKLPSLKTHKLIGKLDNISEVVTEGDMPPEKAVKKYPQLKLTKKEVTTLKNWADNYIKELSGE